MGTHQHQPVGIRVHFRVLDDVPARHPRAHDAKRKRRLRNLDDGEHVRMRNVHVPAGITMERLV
jgi:hypothetical protein